ncbi:MAG: AI-2E family transporter [Bacilli bacterium]|nr:AI-2E family transporter [Bacilli bacterium]
MKDYNKSENKIDYNELNGLIKNGRVVTKFLVISLILSFIIFGFIILEKTNILSIIGTLLRLMLPLFIGWMLSWLVEPLIKYLEEKKIKRPLGTTIVYLALLIVMIIIIVLVVPEFINQLKELIGQLPNYLSKIKDFISGIFKRFDNSEIDVNSIQLEINAQIEKYVTEFTSNGLSGVVNVITKILSSGVTVGLSLIIGFYISLRYDKYSTKFNENIPKKHRSEVLILLGKIGEMTRRYVNGTLFSSVIVTIFTLIGLLISGISSPLLFAVFCGITNIIPYFGPFIGGIPTIIVGFSISPLCGLICLITILVVQAVEGNIINPWILGRATDINPIVIVVALIVFEHFFGILGMILAAPVIGAIKILFNYFDHKYHLLDRLLKKEEEV